MVRELQDQGFAIGRSRIARLTSSHKILQQQDLIRNGVPTCHISGRAGWLYLAVVIDLFARRVISWAVSDRLHRKLALQAPEKAVTMR